MSKLQTAGRFRARIMAWGLTRSSQPDSQSVGIRLEFSVLQYWNPSLANWEDWSQQNLDIGGTVWIIQKNGQPNEKAVIRLMDASGWDGSLDQIEAPLNTPGAWDPRDVQITVDWQEYNGKNEIRVAWVNGWDDAPGMPRLEASEVSAIKNAFGSKLRAVVANKNRNAPRPQPVAAPAVRPAPPPPPASSAPAAPEMIPATTQVLSESRPDGSYQASDGNWYTKDGQRIPF